MERRKGLRAKSGGPHSEVGGGGARGRSGALLIGGASSSLLESAWSGLEARRDFLVHATETLAEINERCLEGMVQAQRQGGRAEFELVRALRAPLRSLTPEIRRRLAGVPFLLVDIQFGDEDWWRSVTASPARRFQSPAWKGGFSPRLASSMGRASLMFARQSLRVDAPATRVLCGLTSVVAGIIGSVRLSQLERVAELYPACVRPRWEDRPAVWRRLLGCAIADDRQRLREFRLHALQLQAGEVAPVGCEDGRPRLGKR